MSGLNNKNSLPLCALIHFVNNHSGAAKYSQELMSQTTCLDQFCCAYIYTNAINTDEFKICFEGANIIAHIPPVNFHYINEQNNYIDHVINLISLYVGFEKNVIVHDNGVIYIDDKLNEYLKSKRRFKIIHTLHYLDHSKLPLFDYVILVTKHAFDFVNGDVHHASLIYNGVNKIPPVDKKNELRDRYGFGMDEVLVLYAGRIEQSKGIHYLAQVFTKIDRENLRLIVVGDGIYDLVLNKIKRNHSKITFTGKLDNSEVHNLMAACDIGVIPSLNEQCSYVALEMMSHGMAIIASEVRGMGELFVGKDIALTVPVDYTNEDVPELDTKVLKQHILTLVSDKALRKRLGKNAQREWAEHYTAERMARETMNVYRELTAQF